MSGLACSIPEAVRTVEELCQVSQHRHHHHHHYNRHHHPRNKLADQAELFNPNGGDRFWPEHFWPMSRSSQVCRGMFLIIRNLKYFDTIQTFLIRQNWGVKKTMFTLLFYSYFQIYFLCSTHCIGFNTADIVPFDQEISRGLQDLPQALLSGKPLVAGKSLGLRDRTSYSFSKHVSSSRQRNPLSPTGGLQVSPSSFCVPANMWSSHPGIVINNYEMIKHL